METRVLWSNMQIYGFTSTAVALLVVVALVAVAAAAVAAVAAALVMVATMNEIMVIPASGNATDLGI